MVSIAAMRARAMSPAVAQTNIGARRVARRHIRTSAGWRRWLGASAGVVVSDIRGAMGIWSVLWLWMMGLSRNISYMGGCLDGATLRAECGNYLSVMTGRPTIEDLKLRGAATPAPEDLRALYRVAFEDFGLRALWSSRAAGDPTIADVLAITESLRVEGGVAGRRLAEEIVSGCLAAL